MKFARFISAGKERYGVVDEGRIEAIAGEPYGGWRRSGTSYKADGLELLSPVRPGKVVAVGLNYTDHAAELGMPLPGEPIIFVKPSTAVIGAGSQIIMPKRSGRVDYEAELAVVIGSRVKGVSRESASEAVFGYTCSNDVTARDLQELDGQWTRCKGFDTFCPLGPWVETELDPGDLEIRALVNGCQKQSSRTSQMIFKVDELVAFISSVMTLEQGDVIMTGTPPGVGPLQPGDRVRVEIEGIGSLMNPVRAE